MQKRLLLMVVLFLLELTPIIPTVNVIKPKTLAHIVLPEGSSTTTLWHLQDGSSPAPCNIVQVIGSSHNSRFVYILVNSSLWEQGVIAVRLLRYKEDLEATGFGAVIWSFDSGTPQDIRAWLISERKALRSKGNDLAGCLLVGNIPAAWYEMTDVDNGNNHEEFPIDLFYMDLDGTWTDSNNNSLYDKHEGNTAPDIWVGRLKADNMATSEISLIENYFDKDHAYRTGSLALPQTALVYVDDDWVNTPNGINTKAVAQDVAKAYIYAGAVTLVDDNATTCKSDYLNRLTQGWNFVDLLCHGSSGSHGFKIPDPNHPTSSVPDGYPGPTIQVWGNPDVKNSDPHVFFYNLFVCSGASFTDQNYVDGWYVFAPTYGLAAVGSVKPGGMVRGEDLFYGDLGQSFTLGDAFQNWFTTWGEQDSSMYYGLTILGDPTLSLSGKHRMTINTPGLDSASNVVHYTKNGVGMTGSISGGTWSDFCDHGTQLYIDNNVLISDTERYYTIDMHVWSVAEPLTYTVSYFHQFKNTITTTGLPYPAYTTVSWVQNAISKQTGSSPAICDGNDFVGWCDAGSLVTMTNPVDITAGEQYYSTSDTSWIVSSAFTATVEYFHQYFVTCKVTTTGVGHQDLDASNHVTVWYMQSGASKSQQIYDGLSISDWVDTGESCSFENPSSSSTSTHSWFTSSQTWYKVTGSITISLPYYEQFYQTISTSGGLLTSTYQGTANYVQFGTTHTGHYWDESSWSDWCDIGSTLTGNQIVAGPPNERYHTSNAISWTVTESATHSLPYHKEYKITIKAEGLPDTLSTKVTISTADPSSSDGAAGGDIDNYNVTLSSSATPKFTWTNWVHADASLTATSLIEASDGEKYVLVSWTKDGSRLAPSTIKAEVSGLTYSAQYAGVKKEMSTKEANLSNSITVTIKISNPPAGTGSDKVNVIDYLPNEFSFVYGSAKVNGVTTTPTILVVSEPVRHQQITFEIQGSGQHIITFDVKVNRAYASDTNVENNVSVHFHMQGVSDVPADVSFSVTVHPYTGATLSVSTDGPTIVPVFTKESWIFTYIVKNNYAYSMINPTLKDLFGAELVYDPNTVRANLLTTSSFSTSGGKSAQVRFSWSLPSLQVGEAFMLQVTVTTGKTPSPLVQQQYASPGVKSLSTGSTLKWSDTSGVQQSLETGTIHVTAVYQIYGHVIDQYGANVPGATVELYYGGKLIMTAQTDSSGLYSFAQQLTQSGTYTVKIKSLPKGYVLGSNPSEKTATYIVGQANPTMTDFTVQKT